MIGCLRHVLPAAVGFCGITAVWAGAGYLPEAGPAPLRFRVLPTPPPTNRVSQPVPPPVSVKLPSPTSPTSPTPPGPAPVPATNAPAPVEYNARDSGAIGTPATPSDGVISPQMLIKYFTSSTNGTGKIAVTPVGFTPPTVAVPGPMPQPASHPTPSTPP